MSAVLLCIDDEPIGLDVRKRLLETQGYRVLTATGGPEGLELFARNAVSMVVLDYLMPGMNGAEVAAELKRRNPAVPILLLSAYVDLPSEALDRVDACAVKGESTVAFLQLVRKLLNARAPARD